MDEQELAAMEQAAMLFGIVESCQKHGNMFSSINRKAMEELKQINDELTAPKPEQQGLVAETEERKV